MRRSQFLILALSIFATVLTVPAAHANKEQDIKDAGDIVQLLLPATAWTTTIVKGDREGFWQYTKVLTGSVLTAQILKPVLARTRPDVTDERSYPSGHTTAAFSAPEFLRIRYHNPWLTIPTYAAAFFVGYSRIQGNKHFRDDVLAGASNALLWNWYQTTPIDASLSIKPAVYEEGGVGVDFLYSWDGHKLERSATDMDKPRWKFVYEGATTDPYKNDVRGPSAGGTPIDLALAQTDPDISTRVTLDYFFKNRHEVGFYIAPLETIDLTAPSEFQNQTVFFAGLTYDPNVPASPPAAPSTFFARYRFAEIRGSYRFTWVDSERWKFKVGAALQYLDTAVEISQLLETDPITEFQSSEASVVTWRPLALARLNFKMSRRNYLDYELDTYPVDNYYINTALTYRFQATPAWNFGIGARWIRSKIDESELYNRFDNVDIMVQIGHSFF